MDVDNIPTGVSIENASYMENNDLNEIKRRSI